MWRSVLLMLLVGAMAIAQQNDPEGNKVYPPESEVAVIGVTPLPPEDFLIAFWQMEESGASDRVDSEGTNDLSVTGTVGQDTGWVGNAATFAASAENHLSGVEATPAGSWTLAAMVLRTTTAGSGNAICVPACDGRPDATANQKWRTLWAKDTPPDVGANDARLQTHNGTAQDGSKVCSPTYTLQADVWYLVTIVHDSTLPETWINVYSTDTVTVDCTTTTPSTQVLNPTPQDTFWVGGTDLGSFSWEGSIDEMRIWSEVKTLDYVRSIYPGV